MEQQTPPQNSQQSSSAGGLPAAWLPARNKPALIGYYLGIIGLFPALGFPFAVAALVLGIIGLRRDKVTKVPGARAHAITAIVLGGLPVAGALFLGLMILVTW